MKIGGIPIAQVAINNARRIAVLEKITTHVNKYGSVTQSDIATFQAEAVRELQAMYPEAGIRTN